MTPFKLSSRLESVRPSATVAITTRAAELKAAGVDILSFSVGEPDFDTPEPIRAAAHRAIDSGATRYTAARGIAELREAVCEDSLRRRGVEHTAEEVVVSVGAKHGLFNLALALYEPGDEVIIPAPYWVSYPEHARLVGAEGVIVETREEDGFLLTAEGLEAAITPKTKALVLCSPSNPTGAAYDSDALRSLADVASRHSFWIIVDEIYGQLVYGGFQQKSILQIAPELKDRIIIVDGVSKAYAMTGWRIGWILAPAFVAKACDILQGQSTTNPATVAQFAALEALRGDQASVARMRVAFERRRALIVDGLNAIDGFRCRMPEGAFYAFVNVSQLLGRQVRGGVIGNDLELASYLLEEAGCAVVPGTAFGAPGHLRLSYAVSEAQIEAGLARIAHAVEKLG